MSDKDIQRLIELAESRLANPFTPEEALASLISAGIFDENGEYTKPYQEMMRQE